MGETRRTRGLQRGPRSQEVVALVRDAAITELARVGVHGLTIDAVAKKAGVSRSTIYRRWPTKAALFRALVEPVVRGFDEDPDTGSIRDDLLALLLLVRELRAQPERDALSALARADVLPEVNLVREDVRGRLHASFMRAFDRARERGEVDPQFDSEAVIHLALYGVLMWDRNFGAVPSEDDCRRILQILLPPLAISAEPAV